jgi:hypothetical protein
MCVVQIIVSYILAVQKLHLREAMTKIDAASKESGVNWKTNHMKGKKEFRFLDFFGASEAFVSMLPRMESNVLSAL